MAQRRSFRQGVLLGALLWILLTAATAGLCADLPKNLILVTDHVTLDNCTFKDGATIANLEGSGTLTIRAKIAGQDLDYPFGSVNFSNLVADASGQVTGGTISVPAKKLEDFLSSGITLDIKSGNLTAKKDGAKYTTEFAIKPVIITPLNDSNGKPLEVDFQTTGAKLILDSTGLISFTCTGGKVGSSAGNDGTFSAAGLKVKASDLGLSLTSDSTATKFEMTCGTGKVSTSVPDVLSIDQGELNLQFTNLKVNEAGEVSVANMVLDAGTPVEISLSNPLDFILKIVKAEVSIDKNKPTKFDLTADVSLPESITDDKGQRVTLSGVKFDVLNGAVGSIADADLDEFEPVMGGGIQAVTPSSSILSSIPELSIGGFKAKISGLTIDLSREGPNDLSIEPGITGKDWQGVFIKNATITLPDQWKTESDEPITIKTTNCYVDTNGFSGDLEASSSTLTSATIGGFKADLSRLRLEVRRNSVVASDCKGSITVEGMGTLNLDVNISDSGTTASVVPDQPLSVSGLGLKVSVFGGTLHAGPEGNPAIWIDGAVALDVEGYDSLKNTAMSFHGLGIDSNGEFVFTNDGWISLDNPANVDFGVFKCNISSLGFRKESDKWLVDINGELSINADLPVTGTVTFKHLRIIEGPTVSIAGIGVQAEVQNTVKVSALLEEGKNPDGSKYMSGAAELEIIVGGSSAPMGGGFELFIADNGSWAVTGNVDLPTGIALGNTGLGLYGFAGGLARNMTPKNESADFSSINDLVQAPGSNKWIFMAGCNIATMADPNLFYAKGRLTVGIPDFWFNIHGDGWFLTDDHSGNAPVVVDVFLDPTVPLFRVGAGIDLKLPSNSLALIKASGGLELLLSPSDVHLAIGWPYPEEAITADVLNGVLTAKFGLLATPASFRVRARSGFDYYILSGSIEGDFGYSFVSEPYLWGSVYAEGEVDFWIASLGASASLTGELWNKGLYLSGEFCVCVGMPWPIPDIEGCAGMSGWIP